MNQARYENIKKIKPGWYIEFDLTKTTNEYSFFEEVNYLTKRLLSRKLQNQ